MADVSFRHDVGQEWERLAAISWGFLAGELLKSQANSGRRRELYYFRDQQGLEVDFVLPGKGGALRFIEVKTTRTPTPDMAAPMQRLALALRRRRTVKTAIEMLVVHRQPKTPLRTSALAPGVRAVGWEDFVQQPLS